MPTATGKVLVFCALVAGGGVILWLQRETAVELRSRIEQVRRPAGEVARLRAEGRRLAAAQVPATELENLRADHAAVGRLRAEIDALKEHATHPTPTGIAAGITKSDIDPAPAAMAPYLLPEKGWKNAGRATPGAAVETALWATAEGNLDALAATFVLQGGARARAEAILTGLPETVRALYGTPEKLIALFIAKDVPLSVRLGGVGGGREDMEMTLRLQTTDGGLKETNIALRRDPNGWRLVVPEAAVEKYGAMLAGAPAAGADGKTIK